MSFVEGVTTSKQPYKYNGKELDTEKGLNLYDYSARLMDPVLGRFSTVDPSAEKYYGISPYAYCANNPLKYIDPDGRKIVIWYRNGSGKQESFVFNGQNISVAPKNGFVRSVIVAYSYDVGHGGGKNLKIAAMSSKFNIGVVETTRDNKYIFSNGGYIRFNTNAGLQLNDGSILSPATGLEHEAAHGVNDKTIGLDNAPDANYHTVEERKVIKGAELDTAKANGELSKTHQGRKKHSEGQWIVTKSVTSNQELNTQQSEELRKK